MDNYTNEPLNVETTTEEVAEKKSSAMGIVAMILGILSIPLCCCTYTSFIAFVMAVVAIVLAIVDKKKNGKFSGFSLAGLICGIVGAVWGLCWIIYWIFIIVFYIGAMVASA